jgi:hypothetical protein
MKGLTIFGNVFSAIIFVLFVSMTNGVMPGHLFDYTTRTALAWINPRRRPSYPTTN